MKVFEDSVVSIDLLESSAALGQVSLQPQTPVKELIDLPSLFQLHVWRASSAVATAVFEGLGAHGTNIILVDGDGVSAQVIPRFQDDGIDLFWEPTSSDPAALTHVANKVRDALWYVNKSEEAPVPRAADEPAKAVSADPKSNLKVRKIFFRSP